MARGACLRVHRSAICGNDVQDGQAVQRREEVQGQDSSALARLSVVRGDSNVSQHDLTNLQTHPLLLQHKLSQLQSFVAHYHPRQESADDRGKMTEICMLMQKHLMDIAKFAKKTLRAERQTMKLTCSGVESNSKSKKACGLTLLPSEQPSAQPMK